MDTSMAPSQRFDPYAHGLSSGYSDIFTPFLGPAPRPEKTSAYSKRSYAKYDLPEAHVGESEFLRDTVEDWMLTANQTWYTERIMPWYRTDQIHVEWTQWENNAHFMGITPHQAMSQLVTSKRTIRKASMLRRGIAAEFENDFVGTALGRSRFVASLAQIARSVQETANVEVLRALLGCHRYQQVYIRKHGIISEGDLDGYLERKADRFMIAQKERFGLETLNVEINREQEMYQATSNVWILGREVMEYCDFLPEKSLYHLGGQEAVDRVNGRLAGPNAAGGTMGTVDNLNPTRWVKDTPVYLAKSYALDMGASSDLLSRTVEVGVFNIMVDRCRNYKEYTSASRNILVYDNKNDDWAEITLRRAIEMNVLWGTDGDVFDPFANGGVRGRQMHTDASIEGQNDFLRYGGWESSVTATKQDVKYIGDLDQKWMTVGQALNAGQTVLNAILRQEPNLDLTAQGAIGGLMEKAKNLIGDRNVFYNPNPEGNKKYSPGTDPVDATDKYKVIPLDDNATAQDRNAAMGRARNIGSEIPGAEQKQKDFLTQTLGTTVPETHRSRLNDIVNNTNVAFEARAEKVRDLILEAYDEDPSSFAGKWDDRERIGSWYQNRINQFSTAFAQWAEQQARMTPGLASASVRGNIQHVPIGQPLPQGMQYLNDFEKTKATMAMSNRVPSSLKDFGMAHFFEPVGADSSSSTGMSRRRAGGAFARPIGADADRGATFSGRGEPDSGNNDRLLARFGNLDKRIRAIAASSAPPAVKYLAQLYLGARFNKNVFLAFCDSDIYVPAGFLLMRTHATYRTRYGIKCADGGRTGYTFFGNSNMAISHEVARKVGLMHYTAYLSAIVFQPKNVYVVQDLFCERYLGGMGVSFWTRSDYLKKGANRIQRDIVCTILPPNMPDHEGNKLDMKIDVRGHWYTHHTMKLADDGRMAEVCYPGASRTAAAMGWWDPVRKSKAIDQASRSRKVDINFTCWQGVQFHYNTKNGTWGDVITEKGNFGEKVGPGCGKVRNGKIRYLETPSYLSSRSLA